MSNIVDVDDDIIEDVDAINRDTPRDAVVTCASAISTDDERVA